MSSVCMLRCDTGTFPILTLRERLALIYINVYEDQQIDCRMTLNNDREKSLNSACSFWEDLSRYDLMIRSRHNLDSRSQPTA